jgi:hypothetical protein
MVGGKTLRDAQTETDSFAMSLSRKEGLEYFLC